MDDNPEVAVVLLNWNGFDDTVECLESLKDVEYENYKVVLVDNASENNEGKRLCKLFPHVKFIQNNTNRGFAGGNNVGINWAIQNDFDYVVTLNNDTTVEPDWLGKLVGSIVKHGADFGSSMILYYEDRNRICSYNDILLPDGSAICLNRNARYQKSDLVEEIFSACGAGAIFSCKCLQEVAVNGSQYFNELYFAYYEDVDLALRLHAKKFKGIVDHGAVIYHKHSKSAGRYSELKMFHSEKNRLLNEILNFPWYLVPAGELFFFCKLLYGFWAAFTGSSKKTAQYRKNIGVFRLLIMLFKARLWVLGNFSAIMRIKALNKKKGLLDVTVTKWFNWDLTKFVRF